MSTHELKTDPGVFDDVAAGLKTFEIRKDDRGFEVGDTLVLRRTEHTGSYMRWHNTPCIYSDAAPIERTVSHILRGPAYGLAEGWVIMSFASPTPAPSAKVSEGLTSSPTPATSGTLTDARVSMTSPQLLEAFAKKAGMVSLLNQGAASCVHSDGCNGVTQAHLTKFCELVAAYCVDAMADMVLGAATPTQAPASQPAGVSEGLPVWFADFMERMGSLADRSSPEDEPDVYMANYDEIKGCLLCAIENAARESVSEPVEQPTEGEPVATIRTWHKNGEQHADAWEWLDALGSLPDGVHRVYTHPQPGGDAPDPMNYKGMFTAAVSSLAEISAALGIEDEDAACANGNELILEAIARKNEALMAAVTRPVVGGDAVLVPRDLLGAACSAIDKKRDAPQTLAELRRYTTGDLSGVIGERAHGIGGQGGGG